MTACTSSLKGKLLLWHSLVFSVSLALTRGVTDSSDAETFPLCHEVGGRSFPCQYLKVVPLQSWGGVLYSIWYMELQGVAEKAAVLQAEEWLHQVCCSLLIELPWSVVLAAVL